MVLFSSFGSIDAPTPHGGPAFQGWRQGFGFGKAPGPGGHVMAPNMPMQLRYTPSEDRCFSATAFWKTKWEVGPAAAFGFGDRPSYKKDDSVAPNNYGDISKLVGNTRNQVLRANISLHPKFPSMEERYRDLSWPKSGPGPGKYDTRIPAGQGSWFNATANPSWSMQSRPIIDGELRAGMGRPGAGEYDVRVDPGKNSPIKHGTLYDIKVKGRHPPNDIPGAISPGPARYNMKEGFDAKGLLEKIMNVPIPKTRKPAMPRPDGEEEAMQDAEAEGYYYEARRSGERGRSMGSSGKARSKAKHGSSGRRKLPRVESSPAVLV